MILLYPHSYQSEFCLQEKQTTVPLSKRVFAQGPDEWCGFAVTCEQAVNLTARRSEEEQGCVCL